MTIAFGHGLAVAPLQAMMAVGALVNGGTMIKPTFLKRTEEAAKRDAPRVVRPEVSESMRYLMRLNAEIGSAKTTNIPGYFVGGKTGTAEKVIGGRYSKNRLFTTFMAIAPADKPKYLFLTILDEPQALPETHGYATAAWNSGAVTGKIVERVGTDPGPAPALRSARTAVPAAGQAWLRNGQQPGQGRRRALMRLSDLLAAGAIARDCDVTGITADSRAVVPGSVFFAVAGTKADGLSFAPDAVRRGALAVVAERRPEEPLGAPVIEVADVRAALSHAAARLHPRQPAVIAAVTGTSGKTSVATFLRQIWRACGRAAASLGTVGLVTPAGDVYGALTTPDPVTLHATLDRIAGEGVTHLAMEASSHGLDQRRLDGVRLCAAGFTNLSRDHLDYHADLDSYLQAKLRLFDTLLPASGAAVVDADSEVSASVVATARARGVRVLTVGRQGDTILLERATPVGFESDLVCVYEGQRTALRLPLAGGFQVSNALVAAGLAIASGEQPGDVFAALEKLEGAAGRLEHVGDHNGEGACSSTTRTSPMRSKRRLARSGL